MQQAIEEYGFSTNQNGIKRTKGLAVTIYDSLNELTIHAELFKHNDSEKKLVFEFIDYLFSKITTNAIAVDSQVTTSYHKTSVNFFAY